jgi:branched-chain amino acid transport system substrate-binding protein
LTRQDHVNVVHGGILSASREAIRPTLRKAETLYFYNTQYEGGVCDRNTFCTGVTPAQQSEVLLPAIIKKWGKKIYSLAADYNYGQITAKWVQHYAQANGGEIVQTDFFPLDVADFGATITKIQEAKPDIVMSILVGGAHMSFYRQWAAAGMNAKIPMASTTLCVGNEHRVLTPAEGNGIMVAYSWSQERDTPENKAFLEKWQKAFGSVDDLHELAVATYQGMNLWAEGVRKAGSIDRMKVIEALETGISFVGPAGKITIDPPTHHAINDVLLMQVEDQKMKVLEVFPQRAPVDTQAVCDLKKNPDDNQQYEIKI